MVCDYVIWFLEPSSCLWEFCRYYCYSSALLFFEALGSDRNDSHCSRYYHCLHLEPGLNWRWSYYFPQRLLELECWTIQLWSG